MHRLWPCSGGETDEGSVSARGLCICGENPSSGASRHLLPQGEKEERRRTTRPLAYHLGNLTAPFPPPRDPNGLRIVQLYPLFSPICCQNRLQTLRTSDVGTIDRR